MKRKQQEKYTQTNKTQRKGHNTNTHCSVMSINMCHGKNMALTSSSTRHNMSVGETCVNGQKQHTVVDNYGPPTAVRNLMGEFHGVKITETNGRQRMKSLQNDGEQKDSREKLHTLEWTQQYKTPYPQKTQESIHNGNSKCTIVPQNSNNNTNIQACGTSNIQNMHLVQTHIHVETEDTLSSSGEDIEGQMQTPNKRKNTKTEDTKENRTNVSIQDKETTRANDTTQ